MSNHGDYLGRLQDNWRQRATETTTLRSELRLVPRWLIRAMKVIDVVAVAFVIGLAIFRPEGLGTPLLIKVVVLIAIVMGGAIVLTAFVFLIGYIGADSKRRGMNPLFWVLVSLLVPYLIGVILYFVIREPLPMECPQCGHSVNPHFNFCPSCQFNLRPNCPQCRCSTRVGDRFCPYCGFALQPDTPTQVAEPTA